MLIPAHFLLAGVITFFSTPSNSTAGIDEANRFFDSYVAMERAFDPAISGLYDEFAKIEKTRRNEKGETQTFYVSVPRYKAFLHLKLPYDKRQGNVSQYSNVSFSAEGDGVRINAEKHSRFAKGSSSSVSMLVAPNLNGQWRIHEQIIEQNPVEECSGSDPVCRMKVSIDE